MSIARRACLTLLCLLPLLAQAKSAQKAQPDAPGFEYIEMMPAFVVNFGTTGRIGYLKAEVSLRVSAQAADAVDLNSLWSMAMSHSRPAESWARRAPGTRASIWASTCCMRAKLAARVGASC